MGGEVGGDGAACEGGPWVGFFCLWVLWWCAWLRCGLYGGPFWLVVGTQKGLCTLLCGEFRFFDNCLDVGWEGEILKNFMMCFAKSMGMRQ